MSENNFSRAIKKSGLSKKAIAQEIGVNPRTITRWEREETPIPLEKAIRIAEITNVSLAFLLDATENIEEFRGDELGIVDENGKPVFYSPKRNDELIEQYKIKIISDFENFLREHDLLVSDYDITNLLNLINYYNVNNMKHPLFERALQERGSDQSKKFLKDNGYSKLGDLFQSSKAFDDFKKSKGYDGDKFL